MTHDEADKEFDRIFGNPERIDLEHEKAKRAADWLTKEFKRSFTCNVIKNKASWTEWAESPRSIFDPERRFTSRVHADSELIAEAIKLGRGE